MNAASDLCIRCLLFVTHCDCAVGPRVHRHPTDCGCSMCDIGRGEYNDDSDDDAQ